MPNRRYVQCVMCDREIDSEYESYAVRDCGCCFVCEGCETPNTSPGNGRGGVIHPYSYKPRYLPRGNYPDEVLMGIELEMGGEAEYIAGRVAEVDGTENHLYCKSDCSIYGTEIVSHPMTLAYIKQWGGYDTLLDKLRDDECFTDKCICRELGCGDRYCDHEFGLHIHVSRNAFRQLRKRRVAPEPMRWDETYEQRIGREYRELMREQRNQQAINHQMIWLMFLERNSDKLNGDMGLARRDSAHYGAFKKSDLQELRRKGSEDPYYDEARYTAINCQNSKTYELRFFKSTTDTEELYGAIEFADASVEFTRTLNANDVLRSRGLEWSNFGTWVSAQETDGVKKYPNLIAQIAKCDSEATTVIL